MATVLGVLGIVSVAQATPPQPDPTVVFEVVPGTSSPNAVTPVQQNPSADPILYQFTIASGTALNETIPLWVCLNSVSNPGGFTWSDTVVPDNVTPGVPGISVSPNAGWDFTDGSSLRPADSDPFSDSTGCQSGTITIATGVQTNDTNSNTVSTSNISFKTENGTSSNPASGKGKVSDSFDNGDHIQVKLYVTPAQQASDRISCYMTDSEGNELQTCDGELADESGETDGTFAIVANRKHTVVATNPGQFYYNLLWENDTGSDQTVDVNMALTGLVAHGVQAVHWLNFPTPGFGGVTPADFNQVIEGNPAGNSGTINDIVVPDGYTLYVTFHLEWDGVGHPAPNCGACGAPANTAVTVEGTVSGSFNGSPDVCTAGAMGFNKQ